MSSNNDIIFASPQKSPGQILNNITSAVNKTKSVIPYAFIHRVPKEIRRFNESAYTPRLVSIGPLHLHCQAEQHIQKSSMQDIKMYYVDSLLDRVSSSVSKSKLEVLKECVDEMKRLTERAKECYAEQVEVLDEEMLVIDGCFILELLYRYYLKWYQNQNKTQSNESSYQKEPDDESSHQKEPDDDDNDPIFENPLTFNTVQHDLLLVENQLPFFVLKKLFSLTVDRIQNSIQNRFTRNSLGKYVLLYFEETMRYLGPKSTLPQPPPPPEPTKDEYCHILHIVHDRYSFEEETQGREVRIKCLGEEREEVRSKCWKFILWGKFMEDPPQKEDDKSEIMPCASELVYAGVKFKACNGEHPLRAKFSERPFGWFHRARFEIPTLYIYDTTEPFLRNLIAFEQCVPSVSRHFTSYALLMDRLVNDEKDIKVLEKAGVIRNNLGAAEEAYNLFNKLCKEVVEGECYYAKTCEAAFDYSNRCWPAAIASARGKYFATPWSSIAFCVASILSIIALIQFIRSFFP